MGILKTHYKLLLLFLIFSSSTVSAQLFSFQKTPSWVKSIDFPKKSLISKYDINSGYYMKLYDYQINIDSNEYYFREVRKISSYSGITNASQLSVSYDTSYQQLEIHHLYIWRNNQRIDRTKEMSLEILNNEYQTQQGIYTGRITAYDILKDIRKDDLIDFAYSITGDNPIFNGEKYLFIPLESENPIDLLNVIILFGKDNNYDYKISDSLKMTVSEVNNYKEIAISDTNLKAFKYEDHTPSWIIPYKYFVLSSSKSWVDVNKWAQEVFSLNKKPKLSIVFDEIFIGNETTEDKINKIINYVQDDIRYMGIESGIGSIKPFPPEKVVEQRFGDCKDKSLLLVSLLKDIGIEEAYPALVNTLLSENTDIDFPNNQIFNHCIVTFNYEDSTYWVDPSITQQGGDFKKLFMPNYGKALIIGKAHDSLIEIPSAVYCISTEYTDTMIINSFTKPAELKMISKRYNYDADNRRMFFEQYTVKDLSKTVIDSYSRLFPVIKQTSDIKIDDDIESNILSIYYNYEVNGFWQDENANKAAKEFWIFRFEPLTIYQYINISPCEERKYDYQLNYPLNISYKMVFIFPDDIIVSDNYKEFDNNAFLYSENIEQIDRRTVQIYYRFKVKDKKISASDYQTICKEKNEITNNLPIIFYFKK